MAKRGGNKNKHAGVTTSKASKNNQISQSPQRQSTPRAVKRPSGSSSFSSEPKLDSVISNKKTKLSPKSVSEEVNFHISERVPGHCFDDLCGMNAIKERLIGEIVMPFAYQNKANCLNIDIPRGVLLVGVPGTGKTAMVDCIVTELRRLGKNVRYFRETGSCMSKYYGETEGNIRELFRAAHEGPCVLFLDEVDGLGKARSGNESSSVNQTVVTTLLSEIDSLDSSQVLLVAATNNENHVDPALIRAGRFDASFHVPSPDCESRKEILELYLKKKELRISNTQIDMVVKSSKGLTGSDLECIVKQIHRKAIARVFPSYSWCTMKQTEIEKKKQLARKVLDEDILPVVQQYLENVRRKNGDQ